MRIEESKFATKKDLFDYLCNNKKEIIDLKKSALKFSDCFGMNALESEANKALNTHYKDEAESGTIKRTIIGNTYNWLDSHGDVHLSGLFSKSIAERENKIWHLHDHEHKITAKVGKPEKIYEKAVQWVNLGINKFGYTEALFMDTLISEEMNKSIFKSYLKGEIDQHSVGMQYVKIELAVNDEEFKEEFATWNKYISQIGNKEKAEDQGYFFAVREAKLIEISAVLEGSNILTPTVHNITPENEPEKSTPENEPIEEKRTINYNYLLTQLKSK
jgi:hypothetical protein